MESLKQAVELYVQSDERKQLEILREAFVNKFNIEFINNMKIDDYVIGHGDKDNFCYWIENRLKELGDIHGSTSIKFAVYYNKDSKKYKWTSWTENDFNKVKEELIDLIKAGLVNDIPRIKLNKISPMLKGKILSIYYPDRYLNIFSIDLLVFYAKKLNISCADCDIIDIREKILDYKNSDKNLKEIRAIDFGAGIVNRFGAPSKNEIDLENKINQQLDDIELKEEINIEIISKKNKERPRKFTDIQIKRVEPTVSSRNTISYKRDKARSIQALRDANYSCEINKNHESFLRKDEVTTYTEAHHLIPMHAQEDFEFSLDVPANIVSLCSNCHNKIHYGCEYKDLLKQLFNSRKERLEKVGLEIDLKKLNNYYKN